MGDVSRFLDPILIQQLNQLQLSARIVVEGSTPGLHRSRVKGASVDFRQHRAYVAGDEPRRLDWRLLGRTDRPYVREYHEETNLRAVLMLDRSGSMAYGKRFGRKFDYAARIVASLAYLMIGQTESVGLGIAGKGLENWLPPHSHPSQLSRLIEAVERAEPRGASSPAAAMHAVAGHLQRRCLIVVVSDFFEPIPKLRAGLARLRHDRHEVIALQTLEPDEIEFPFRAFVRFRGLEEESPTLCDASLLKKTYLENFQRHQDELRDACQSLGVELRRAVIDQPLDEMLVAFLRRTSSMH
jgi:uncharacterized protein (DUF58 family)